MPRAKEGMLKTDPGVVTYCLQTYVKDDVIPKTDSVLMRYIQPSTMSQTRFGKALEPKALRCGEVYNIYIYKEISIEGLHESVCHGMQLYWCTHLGSTLYALPRHATSL